jgi:hypothetical protein
VPNVKYISVIDASEFERKDWMLENFPEHVKHQCKLKALSQRQTLKVFVENTLRAAVGMPVIDSSNENRQRTIRRSSAPNARKRAAKNLSDKRPETGTQKA